jgi:hypothetical protein
MGYESKKKSRKKQPIVTGKEGRRKEKKGVDGA